MELSHRKVPIYGQLPVLAVFEQASLLPDDAELFFVYEGSRQLHVAMSLQLDAYTLESIIPGHNALEKVTVLVCVYTKEHSISILGHSDVTYIQDLACELVQFMVEYVDRTVLTSHLVILEQYDLTVEAMQALDDQMTAAMGHIEKPPYWNVLGKWAGQESICRETLLHVSVRLGLSRLSQFLLRQPSGIQAAIVSNEEGQTPVDLALENGMQELAEILKDSQNSQVTPSFGVSTVFADNYIVQKCLQLPNAFVLTVETDTEQSLETHIQLLRKHREDDSSQKRIITFDASEDGLSLDLPTREEASAEVNSDEGVCQEISTSGTDVLSGNTDMEVCAEFLSICASDEADFSVVEDDPISLDSGCKNSSEDSFKKANSNSSTYLSAGKLSSMLNGREEIYANCMVVDKVDEGGIKYCVNDVTIGSTSTDHEPYEITSEDHNDQACNSKFGEEMFASVEDQECQRSVGESFEEKIDTTIQDEDQDNFVESVSDLSSPDNIYCRSLLPPRQHVAVKLESHSMNMSHKQSFSFDGLDADSEGEEVSDRSQGSCTPRSPNSVAVFASSGDELDSSETLHESEIKTRSPDSMPSIRNVPLKELEDTGIRLRSYSLSSTKGSQNKSRFARDFNVPDSTSEEQRVFNLTEHPKEKREFSFRKRALSADEEGCSELADSLQHLTLSEFLKEIEEEEWDKYIIPSKSETEKCKVSRTFSFLKSRMTSTRNKGKGKNKDKDTKEKEKWSNGHHFITGTLSGTMQCPFCEKVVAGKDMLQCFNCTLNVHKNCKDSLPMCTKKPQDRYQMISRNKPTHSLQSASIKEASISQSSYSSLNTSSSSLPVGISALKRESSLQPLSKSASSISIERRIMESMDVEMDPYTSRNRSQSEELLQTMGTSPSTETIALEDHVVPSMRGELESDAQEFKAESWSLTVDSTFCDKQEKDLIKRQDVIYELMQTEMHHIQILEIMSEIFRKGMKEDLQFDHSTIDRIFPCLDELLEIHKNFFFCLKERRRESFVEDSERNFFINRIGNILMQQFSDENANKMKQTYGDFCSHHNEAVSVFKELQQQNKKFQHFIRQQSNNLLVRRLGVPECILLVTQRITKYPVLLERILQYTKEGTEEHKDVTKSLSLIKDIIAAVDTKVNKFEKEQKLVDILNKFENKTCAKLKNGHTFRKQDLQNGERELLHDGPVYWKTATGRLKDITGLLLTDVLIFLQDKDQKYTFAAVDQKPAVISLQKLIVREVANEERGMFLISASSAGPEMYEIHTNSKEDRNTWMRLIRLAVESCPEEEVERLSESEEDKRIAEARAARTRKFQERLSCQDQQICTSLEEKLRIYGEMAEKNGFEEAAQDTHLLMKPETTELPQAGPLLNAAIKEVENLHSMLTSQSCNSARRSLEGLGEPVSPHKQEHFGSVSTRMSPTVYASDTRTPSSLSPNTDSEGRNSSEPPVMQSDSELHRPGSDGGIQKIIHSVQNLTQLLYSLQAVVSIQNSCTEVQRLILQERERPPHNPGLRGSLLLEQEKQRNLEKQREELVNVRKLQHQLQQDQQRWELECEWRQREQEAQASRLQERERECQQQAEQLQKEKEDLQSQWNEYQQCLGRLREGMKLVEKEKERVQLQQRQLNACKHGRQRSLPVMMFPQENSQIPVHTRTGSLGGQGLDMASVFVNEAAFHYSLNSHQRNNNMQVCPEPSKVDGYLSSAARTDENQKHDVPVQLVSATNQLLKPATVQQQIPAKLASFSKGNREKNNKVSCDQFNCAKEIPSAKEVLREEDASKAIGFVTRMLPEHPSLIVYPNMNSSHAALFAHQPTASILPLGPSQSQHETHLVEESSVPQEAINGPKRGAEEEEEEEEEDEENIIYL